MKIKYLIVLGFSLIAVILFLSFVNSSYTETNPKYTYGGTYNSFTSPVIEWDSSMCEQGQDFVLQIDAAGCSPAVVRSDLLEEQDVPVFCPIMATKINPLIDISAVNAINLVGGYSEGIRNIGFIPNKAALSSGIKGDIFNIFSTKEKVENPTYENVGSAVIMLRQNSNESSMPDSIKGTINATLYYDLQNAFGIGQSTYYLPVLTLNDWDKIKNQYSFWDRRGYLYAEAVDTDHATIDIYSNVYKTSFEGNINEKRKFDSVTLKIGDDSKAIYLPGFYCLAGLKIRLDDIVNPDTRAIFKIDSEYYEFQEGEKFLNNRCYVVDGSVGKQGINQEVTIHCQDDAPSFLGFTGNDYLLSISPKVVIDVNGEKELYSVGDFITGPTSDNKYLYLGYAKTEGDSDKEEDLVAYIYSTPNKIDPEDQEAKKRMVDFSEKIANYFDSTTTEDMTTLEAIGEKILYAYGVTADEYARIQSGEGIDDIKTEETKDIDGNTIKLGGFGFGETIQLDANTTNYYNSAQESYERIINDYPNEVFTDSNGLTVLNLSLESFKEEINLAKSLQQNLKLIDLCNALNLTYPGYELQECEKSIAFYSSDNSMYNLLIDGKYHEISLIRIERPNFNNYGVQLTVKDKSGNKDSYYLTKDDKRFININNGEYVELKDLEKDSATIKIYVQNASFASQFFTRNENLKLNNPLNLEDYTFEVKKINLKQQAKVSLISEEHYQTSHASFEYNIGIEKRAIQLAPEKIQNRVEDLSHQIEEWQKISDGLNTVVKTMKTACLVSGAALTVKNFVQNADGKSISRQMVMKSSGGWSEYCAKEVSNGQSDSLDQCYSNHANEINKEVDVVYGAMKSQNDQIKEIQSNHPIDSQLKIFGDQLVDTEAFAEDYANQISNKFGGGSIENPSNNKESILYADIKTIFTEEDSLQKGRYSIDDLKNFQLYQSLSQNSNLNVATREKYQQKLYNLAYDLKENSDNFLKMNNDLSGTEFNPSDFIYAKTDRDFEQKNYLGKTIKDYKTSFNNPDNFPENTPVQLVQTTTGNHRYLFILDNSIETGIYPIAEKTNDDGTHIFYIYDLSNGNLVTDTQILAKLTKMDFKVYDASSYNNKFISSYGEKEVVARFYETEPYQGLPAVVPFDLRNGWYAYIQQNVAVFGEINSYDISGRVNSFWLCNVGKNGIEEFNSNQRDDICKLINLGTGQPYNQFPDLEPSEASSLINKAVDAIQQASSQRQKDKSLKYITIFGNKIRVGSPATSIPATECADFMSPKDCELLFNLCDPVICPSSRCDFGGAYPVSDVVQSGIIGSIVLCYPNAKWSGGDVYIPVCLTGVKAGLDGWLSIMNSYKDCLETSLETGQTVGICDEIQSVYMCEFFWRQALPIAKLAIPKVLSALLGQNKKGGGEYMGVSSAWQNAQDSISYFTQYYAADSYKAFRYRDSEQVGSAVCKNFISIVSPSGISVLDSLTEPDSPPQFTGHFEEIPFSTATNPPTSQYKVFYHIYAGNDRGAYYKVYLRESTQSSYYQDTGLLGGVRNVKSGYISKGEYDTQTIDFTAPSGFKELCINVNGQEECGFQEVSTSFAVNYVQDQYIAQQANQTNIKTQKECISGSASFYNLLNLNVEESASDLIDPAIYDQGIIRICASENPGSGSDPNRWIEVGYCDDTNVKCWFDKNSIEEAVVFASTADKTLDDLNTYFINNFVNNQNNPDYIHDGEYSQLLGELSVESSPIKRINMIDEVLSKVYFNNQKAYLFYLKGQAYGDLALSAFESYKKILEEFNEIKNMIIYLKSLGYDKTLDGRKIEDISYEELKNLYEIVKGQGSISGGRGDLSALLITAQNMENQPVIEKDYVLIGNGMRNAYNALGVVYKTAGIDYTSLIEIYSESDGKSFDIASGIIKVGTQFGDKDENGKPIYLTNTNAMNVGQNESFKLNLLRPGDEVDIILGSGNVSSVLFIDWEDKSNNIAKVFDWNGEIVRQGEILEDGRTCSGDRLDVINGEKMNYCKTYGYNEYDLSDSHYPVYAIRRSPLISLLPTNVSSNETLNDLASQIHLIIDNKLNTMITPKITLNGGSDICFKFFDNKWHWSANCDIVGTEVDLDSTGVGASNLYLVNWVDLNVYEDPYGKKIPSSKHANVILGLQNKNYEEGLRFLIESAVSLKEELQTENTIMNKNERFGVSGFSNIPSGAIYFYNGQNGIAGWSWKFKSSPLSILPINGPFSVIDKEKVLNNPDLTNTEKIYILYLNKTSFIRGAEFLFSIQVSDLSGFAPGINQATSPYINTIWDLESAMKTIRPMTGRYGDNTDSKNFIDILCQQGKIFSEEECVDIKGGTFTNWKENFEIIKQLLIDKSLNANQGKWTLNSALLKLDLIKEGNYFDLNREGISLESLKDSGILDSSKYTSLKQAGTSGNNGKGEDIVPDLIKYFEAVLANQGKPILPGGAIVYDFNSAITMASSLTGTYSNSSTNKIFIEAICERELLTSSQCDEIKGGGQMYFTSTIDIPTEVKDMLIENQKQNKAKYLNEINSAEPDNWDWNKIRYYLDKDYSLVDVANNQEGVAPIHYVAYYNNVNISDADFVFSHSLNLSVKTNNGFTPLDLAQQKNNQQKIDLLLRYLSRTTSVHLQNLERRDLSVLRDLMQYLNDENLKLVENRQCLCGTQCAIYANYISQETSANGLEDELLFLSLIMQESSCKTGLTSSAGAIGLTQVTSDTFNDICKGKSGFSGSITSIDQIKNNSLLQIKCGAMILKNKYNSYKGGLSEKAVKKNCFDPVYIPKYTQYTGWEAAIRGYNGWGCGTNADTEYVENIVERYNKLVEMYNNKPWAVVA